MILTNNPTVAALATMVQPTANVKDRKSTALALRMARTEGVYDDVLSIALRKRADWLEWLTVTQRKWQSAVSRRPQRGEHHDSWDIREYYVRCDENR